jgi:hypothetical protein
MVKNILGRCGNFQPYCIRPCFPACGGAPVSAALYRRTRQLPQLSARAAAARCGKFMHKLTCKLPCRKLSPSWLHFRLFIDACTPEMENAAEELVYEVVNAMAEVGECSWVKTSDTGWTCMERMKWILLLNNDNLNVQRPVNI